MNPAFTEFLLILRYIFVIVATATGIRFTLRVERLYRTDRIFEQKYLIILSVAVVLFNDPTAIITIFFPNILRFTSVLPRDLKGDQVFMSFLVG